MTTRNILGASLLLMGLAASLVFLLRSVDDRRGEPEPAANQGVARVVQPLDAPLSNAQDAVPPVSPAPIEPPCVERNNEATRLLAAGELAAAVALFRACVEEVPENSTYRRNLCEALIRMARQAHEEERDVKAAIDALAEALALEVAREDRTALEALLARWREEWDVSGNDLIEPSLYFELVYDPGRDDLLYQAQSVMDLLDEAYIEMLEWFLVDPVRTSGRKIRVAFHDSGEFDRITGLGDWAGGVFDGTIRLAVDALTNESRRWVRVARHELVHAFVRALGGNEVPGWLNEGLAQWLDYSSFTTSYREQQLETARSQLKGKELYPFERLQDSLASWTDREEIARAYAQSVAMVDFIDRYYGRDVLLAMVKAYGEGRDAAAVFRERTAVDLATVLLDLASELSR